MGLLVSPQLSIWTRRIVGFTPLCPAITLRTGLLLGFLVTVLAITDALAPLNVPGVLARLFDCPLRLAISICRRFEIYDEGLLPYRPVFPSLVPRAPPAF